MTPAPLLIAIAGAAGSGKSTLAQHLVQHFTATGRGAVWLSTDLIRKELAGLAATTRLPDDTYSTTAAANVYETLWARAVSPLAAGLIVVVDGSFRNTSLRQRALAVAAEARVTFAGLMLDAARDLRAARVSLRTGDASDAGAAFVLAHEVWTPPDQSETAWHRLDATVAPEAIAAAALAHLTATFPAVLVGRPGDR
jgi:uncharacterized protein